MTRQVLLLLVTSFAAHGSAQSLERWSSILLVCHFRKSFASVRASGSIILKGWMNRTIFPQRISTRGSSNTVRQPRSPTSVSASSEAHNFRTQSITPHQLTTLFAHHTLTGDHTVETASKGETNASKAQYFAMAIATGALTKEKLCKLTDATKGCVRLALPYHLGIPPCPVFCNLDAIAH